MGTISRALANSLIVLVHFTLAILASRIKHCLPAYNIRSAARGIDYRS